MGKFKIGDKVSYKHADGKTYTGIVVEINGGWNNDRNLCRFDGFEGHNGNGLCIGVYHTEDYWFCTDNELTLIEPEKTQPIVIYRKGMEVVALDKNTGRKETAKYNPEDKFDFYVGATLAFKRLMGEEKPPKTPHLELKDFGFFYGTLGEKTPYKDCKGRKLCVGDQVKIESDVCNIHLEVDTLVVNCDGNQFVMGIQEDCNPETGKINDFKVTKIKDHAHLKIGDEIEVTHLTSLIVKA